MFVVARKKMYKFMNKNIKKSKKNLKKIKKDLRITKKKLVAINLIDKKDVIR